MTNDSFIKDLTVGTKPETVSNPYSGESFELTPTEVAVYDFIKGCEMMGLYSNMQIGLDWFKRNNAKAYLTLLD